MGDFSTSVEAVNGGNSRRTRRRRPVYRDKKEVAVAAKESLKIGNTKVFGDIVLFVQ
jgi:hypothetical protein